MASYGEMEFPEISVPFARSTLTSARLFTIECYEMAGDYQNIY